MSKALKHAPEPWKLVNDGVTLTVKDAAGKSICTLYKDHPNLEGNAALIAGAADLSNAVFNYLAKANARAAKDLPLVWKKVRGVKC